MGRSLQGMPGGYRTYLLRCIRYIDLNPVRARIVTDPATGRWSSCAELLNLRDCLILTPHPVWKTLGTTCSSRAVVYPALLDGAVSAQEIAEMRLNLQQQRAPGQTVFQRMVEPRSQRFSRARPMHRPLKQENSTEQQQVNLSPLSAPYPADGNNSIASP